MMNRNLPALLLALAIPACTNAQAAVPASGVVAATTAAAATISQSSTPQAPQGVSASGTRWESVGWLYCPKQAAAPSGCLKRIKRDGWRLDEWGEAEPWMQWLARHKGENARFLGMVVVKGDVKLFYGIPAE